MSHELKTPLNSIIALSQLLQEDDSNGQQEEKSYGDIINASGNELLQMINDILDISKVETGKMEIIWEMVSIEEMIQLINYQFIPITKQKALQFQVDVEANVADSFISDAQRLIQILRNLLINAVKFTEQGSISLRVRMNDNPQSRCIVFSVQDTGIGIDLDKQHLIFEAFQQENGASTRRYGGTGLGLSISLKLAGLLGGSLTMESVKGKGSRFTLSLPLQQVVQEA
ncbi:hypothetical protein G9U52_29930 [Paenibacillus sp. S3N08]|uniref:histidine kinase n=2 Tax=Paenibacillus agricola TaxID=2716264 RepID=A0ABX0JF76_9BACL|nr:hypothetical protein [Paenibacillus agricola]